MTRTVILAVLEANTSRCCDDAADREALADALVTELQLSPHPSRSTDRPDPREDPQP